MATVSKKILWGSSSTDYITVTMDDAVQDQIIKVDSTDNPSSSARSKSVILSTSSDSSVTASLNVMQAAGSLPAGMTLSVNASSVGQRLPGREVRVEFTNTTRNKTYLTTQDVTLSSTGSFTFSDTTPIAVSTIFNALSLADGDRIYADIYTSGMVLLASSQSNPCIVDVFVSDQVCPYSRAFSIYDLDCGNTLDFDVTFSDSYSYSADTTIGGGGSDMVPIPISGGDELIDFEALDADAGKTIQFVAGPNTSDELIASYQITEAGTHTWSIPQSTIQEIIDATVATQVELRYLSYSSRIVNFSVKVNSASNGVPSNAIASCPVTLNYMNVDGQSITVEGTTNSQGYAAFRRADVAKVSMYIVATATPTQALIFKKGTTTININDSVTSVDIQVLCEFNVA